MGKKVVKYKLVRHRWPDEIQADRKRKMRKAMVIAVCFVCFFGGFGVNELLNKQRGLSDKTFAKFSEIYNIMSKEFYFGKDKEDFDDVLLSGAIEGMVNAGEDAHTMYLDAQQSNTFTSSMEGSFVGIGVQYYEEKEDSFRVTRVLNDSPAEKAGLQKGDQIYRIGNTVCKDMDADKVRELILGEAGSSVEIEVLRDGKHLVYDLERQKVNDSVYREIYDEYALLEISSFSETVGDSTGKALEKIKQADAKKLILDLRNNGGGYLQSAQQIASYLLGEDVVIFKEKNRDGSIDDYKTISKVKQYTFDKIILLVNKDTASAAEVLTAALKENLDNVTIVGTNTYGKGTVQYPLVFSDGSMLKYTTAEWISSKGKEINGVGIKPDVEVKLDPAFTTGAPKLKDGESYAPDSVNPAAQSVQVYLKFLGYEVDRSDAYFSKQSGEALKQFQKDHGIKADGNIDSEVIDVLLSTISEEWNTNLEKNDVQMKKAIELVK